jgi:hypothetical protein
VLKTLLVLCVTIFGVAVLAAPLQKAEALSGHIVAYAGLPMCLNGNSYWSIVIHVQSPKDVPSRFVRVEFSLPCNKSPESVLPKSPIQMFHLFRQRECDEVLEERYIVPNGKIDDKTAGNLTIPIWKYLPDDKRVVLPFGEVLPCYRSTELPLAPVV